MWPTLRVLRITASVSVLAVVAFVLWHVVFGPPPDPEARTQLVGVMEKLSPGMSRVAAEDVIHHTAVGKLDAVLLSRDLWLIRTPFESGARNWQLWIEFTNDTIRSLQIRLADSKTMKPTEAPDDQP
jgi:hypothetical protein